MATPALRRNAARLLRRNVEAPSRRAFLGIEPLEQRWTPAVFNVNTLVDSLNLPAGQVSLRMAISAANATPGGNTINLTVPGTYNILQIGPGEDNNKTGDFDILPSGGNLTIQNASGGPVIVSGDGLDRVFDINPADTGTNAPFLVRLVGFAVENGVASPGDGAAGSGGGIRDQGNASLELDNVAITNNTATADGGGVAMENATNVPWRLITNNTIISNNHAGDAGGGIDEDGQGTLQINSGTLITGNTTVNQGGGIWLDAINNVTANTTITSAVITNNIAFAGTGGGVGNAGNAAVVINHTLLQGNFTGTTGGGFGDENGLGTLTVEGGSYVLNNGALQGGGGLQEGGAATVIADSTIQGNVTAGDGGGLLAGNFPAGVGVGNVVAIFDSTFAGNVAVNGGGIEDEAATTNLLDDTLSGNRATGLNGGTGGNGGGIDVAAIGGTPTLNVTQTWIANNQAGNNGIGLGGGIDDASGNLSLTNDYLVRNAAGSLGGGVNFFGGSATIIGTTLDANRALTGGGGLNFHGTATGGSFLINDTIANNITAGKGGGISDDATVPLFVLTSTISGNLATDGGGIALIGVGALELSNTVVAQNGATGTGPDVFTQSGLTVTDLGGNFVGTLAGSAGFGPGTLTGNAMLSPLGDNGGPRAGTLAANVAILTMAPMQGSPLVAAGTSNNAPPIDQRGVTRPSNTKPTIGAYQ